MFFDRTWPLGSVVVYLSQVSDDIVTGEVDQADGPVVMRAVRVDPSLERLAFAAMSMQSDHFIAHEVQDVAHLEIAYTSDSLRTPPGFAPASVAELGYLLGAVFNSIAGEDGERGWAAPGSHLLRVTDGLESATRLHDSISSTP